MTKNPATSLRENWIVVGAALLCVACLLAAWLLPHSGRNEARELTAKSQKLLTGFMRGDSAALDTLVSTEPGAPRGALTPAGAAAAMGSEARLSVEPAQMGSGNNATVNATLHTPAGDVKIALHWKREHQSGTFEPVRFTLPFLNLSDFPSTTTSSLTVNKEEVTQPATSGLQLNVPIWPGASVVQVKRPENAHGTQPAPVTVTMLHVGEPGSLFTTSYRLNPSGNSADPAPAISETLSTYLKKCANVRPAQNLDCPFAPTDQFRERLLRDVRFSEPRVDSVQDRGTDGGVKVSGSVKMTAQEKQPGGEWKQITEHGDFSFQGIDRSSSDGRVHFELSTSSRTYIQNQWGHSLTDPGVG